jgi:hypothetical protein
LSNAGGKIAGRRAGKWLELKISQRPAVPQ